MQWQWAAALVFALMAHAARPVSAADVALGAIDECIARLDVDIDVGFERVAARCPELARHLQSSSWAAWLPAGWQDANNNLSARSLAQLQQLVVRERAMRSGPQTLEMARLQPILAGLPLRKEEGGGWWARLKRWLHGVREPPESAGGDSWLERLTGHMSIPQAVIEIGSYAMLGLVVVLAGYIVVNEWRAAALQRRRTASSAQRPQTQDAPRHDPSWQDVERAAPTDKARVLLQVLAARLTAARRLPASGALTARELTRAARLDDATDRERLGEVAIAAEALLYSAQSAPNASLAAVIERGRELFERLGESGWPPGACGEPI